jgi:hypothetical protein
MNQQIRELVEQAGGSIGTGLEFAVVFGELEDFEKFALLLMREIAMVQITHQAGMDLENKKMDDPAKELNYAVIEHFGVGK